MGQKRDPELLLLLAIAKHCDPFGFCFPGRKTLMKLRHCKKEKLLEREKWLQDNNYIVVIEGYDYRRRQAQFDYQVSPCVVYVREDIQGYCEAVFEGNKVRDYDWESNFLGNLFSTKDSQPEALPESETRLRKPDSGTSPKTRKHNQLTASTESELRPGAGLREAKANQRDSANDQRRKTQQQEKDNPQAGAPNTEDFDRLLSPTFADEDLAEAIRYAVATTPHQARKMAATFQRDHLVHWLKHTVIRRAKGELSNPGAYFYKMLNQHAALRPADDDEGYEIP